MIEVINLKYQNLTDFEKKYCPYMEAETNTPRRAGVKREELITSRTKQITASDRENLTDDIALEDDDINLEDLENMNVDEEDPTDDTTDGGTDNEEINTETQETDDNEIAIDNTEEVPENPNEAAGGETDAGTDEIALDNTGDEETNNDTIEDDNGTDEIALDNNEEDPTVDEGENQTDTETDYTKSDKLHKQNLYRKMMELHDSLERYIHKLESIVGLDDLTNHRINEINEKFKNTRDLLYDYMILRFSKSEYIESMLFYQRALGATNLSLDLLSDVWKEQTATNEKSNQNK